MEILAPGSQIIHLSGPSVSLTIKLEASLAKLNIDTEIWKWVAQVFYRLSRSPIKYIIFGYNELKEEILIEAEASRARIRVGQLRAVMEIYEKNKTELENESWLPESGKQSLIVRIDRMRDKHLEHIIERGW